MGKVGLDKTMSLDGFIAGPNDDVARLFAWYGDKPIEALRLLGDPLKTTGAVVMGRRSFDLIDSPNGWVTPDGTPLPWPVFVLTHEPREKVTRGATTFTFVTDGIESAVTQAKAVAGDKNVGVMGANTAQQCLQAGLLDEIQIHLVPVLLGEGIRLFEHLGTLPIELEQTRVIASPGVTHLMFRVVKDGGNRP
jgi:dihydrofolate reductase